ncbi:glucose-dependent insulinotropic receptor [Ambystoma mexicanum]|uniref:glucose-dependent insulinotropic receptor n=1 Tax=Ambystoma mexicanum TaxID=8296 RepID=UPI0037E736D1
MDSFTFGVVLSCLSCLILASNGMMALALILLIQKSESRGLCFVLNLAVADCFIGIAVTGIATQELSNTNVTAERLCALRMSSITCPSAASILTMVLVALDRYLAIKQPLRYLQVMTAPVVGACLAALWVISGFFGFLPVMIENFQHENYDGKCTFFNVFQPAYMLTVFSVGFFPGMLVFVYFYCDILKIARLHAHQIWDIEQIGPVLPCANLHNAHDIKAIRTVAILIGCFVLFWSPFFVVSIVQAACTECALYEVIEKYLWLLGLGNSLLNPLIYAYWQREVRRQLYHMCLAVKRRALSLLHVERPPRIPRGTECHLNNISQPQLEG